MLKPDFTIADVEILNRTEVYRGHYQLEKLEIRHRLFAGGWSPLLRREAFRSRHAVAILLFDPILDNLVLIEQFRVGIITETDHPWLLEIVAGMIDNNKEEPADTVRREVCEETGLEVLEWLPICEYWVSPSASSQKLSLFCGRVDARQAAGIHGLQVEGEDIYVHNLGISTVYKYLNQGYIRHAPTIIALQWLQLHEQELRRRWPTA